MLPIHPSSVKVLGDLWVPSRVLVIYIYIILMFIELVYVRKSVLYGEKSRGFNFNLINYICAAAMQIN